MRIEDICITTGFWSAGETCMKGEGGKSYKCILDFTHLTISRNPYTIDSVVNISIHGYMSLCKRCDPISPPPFQCHARAKRS